MTMGETGNEPKAPPSNAAIADQLDAVAELLEAQAANPFRVRAYRMAAETVRHLTQPAYTILADEGLEGLRRIPNIGFSISRAIEQLVHSGRLGLLQRLRGETQPERVLATVPGIGSKLAERIHEHLGIGTLGDLEAAAYDGRLAQVPGFGSRRIQAVRESLAGRFRRRPQPVESRPGPAPADQPPVAELLDVDREYRTKAQAGDLPRIAPRRFNPTREAWLPILHTERKNRHYTVLYSNTARAHELGTTHDWVVIYRDDPDGTGQWTVVTSRFGSLQGQRIVRGREAECRAHYEAAADSNQ